MPKLNWSTRSADSGQIIHLFIIFLFIIKYTSIYVAKMLQNQDNIVF